MTARKHGSVSGRIRTAAALFAAAALTVAVFVYWRDLPPDAPPSAAPASSRSPTAFAVYWGAARLIRSPRAIQRIAESDSNWPGRKQYPEREQEAVLLENRQALAEVEKGREYHPGVPAFRDERTAIREGEGIDTLARLLEVQAKIDGRRGDWPAAANAGLETLQIGTDLERGDDEYSDLIGYRCQQTGLREIAAAIPHLSATRATAAERRLLWILRRRASTSGILQNAVRRERRNLLDLLKMPDWRRVVAERAQVGADTAVRILNWCGISTPYDDCYWPTWLRLQFFTRRVIYDHFSTYCSKLQAEARMPYSDRRELARPDDPVSVEYSDLLPETQRNRALMTRLSLISAWLALQAYHMQTGHYPQRLEALVPQDLPQVPADPYSAGGSLRYRQTGAGCVLYSVGPDGRDNGGTPIRGRKGEGRLRGFQLDSIGDIVIKLPGSGG